MADRRTDDTPLAPRRTLAGSGGSSTAESSNDSGSRRPTGGKLSERLQGAVASAGESMRNVTESRKNEKSERTTGQTTRTSTSTPTRPPVSGTSRPRTRKARLRLTHIDPWSVMKTSFLLSVAFGIVTVIAVAVVWSVLGAAGVWDSINQTVKDVLGGDSGTTFNVEDYVGTGRVMGFTMIVAVVDVVLITAIATLTAFIYNLAAALLGGLEVTLAEDER
jgi:hypothetical protein